MAYITATDIARLLPDRLDISGTSTPLSATDIDELCNLVSAELDSAALGAGYAVPVASSATSAAHALMRLYTQYGVGWHVLRTVYPNQGGPADKNTRGDDYERAYTAALRGLRTGDILLPGADPTSDAGGGLPLPRSFSTSHPDGVPLRDAPVGGIDPTFGMGWQP